MFRIAVVGSRDFDDTILMHQVLDDLVVKHFPNVEIISGGARGADSMAEDYAKINGIACRIFHADWETHGKSAGYIRNKKIASEIDQCIAFWNGESRGTKHMIELCKELHVGVNIISTKERKNKFSKYSGFVLPCECT